MQIEPWHVPLLVMAGIIVLELLAVLVLCEPDRRYGSSAHRDPHQWVGGGVGPAAGR
ncbi:MULTISPECIES: hypothetical protein [unclassified Micromonospora]|uniref:hypothetical protein n=1 Tax=unclassified Micromonospora TaxID=2617518 RepID=UPI003A896E1A